MNLRVLIVLLMVCFASSASATTLNVIDGQLHGASNVLLDGDLYDVEFVDGTCIDLFTGCDDPSDFTFTTEAAAVAAAQALLDQVLIDDTYAFDSAPQLTAGCNHPSNCQVATTWASPGFYSLAVNYVDDGADHATPHIYSPWPSFETGTGIFDNMVHAVWSPVPEPTTASLLALGLVGIAAMWRCTAA